MAKIVDGEFYHEECWREVGPKGVHPLTYRPLTTTRYIAAQCAHCGEEITENDD